MSRWRVVRYGESPNQRSIDCQLKGTLIGLVVRVNRVPNQNSKPKEPEMLKNRRKKQIRQHNQKMIQDIQAMNVNENSLFGAMLAGLLENPAAVGMTFRAGKKTSDGQKFNLIAVHQ